MPARLAASSSGLSSARSSVLPPGSPIAPVPPPARAMGRCPASWSRRSIEHLEQAARRAGCRRWGRSRCTRVKCSVSRRPGSVGSVTWWTRPRNSRSAESDGRRRLRSHDPSLPRRFTPPPTAWPGLPRRPRARGPVIHDAASDARNSAALAMSSGSPRRFSGRRLATASPDCSHSARAKSVRTRPGANALTRTPGPSSAASWRVRWTRAALVTLYQPMPVLDRQPADRRQVDDRSTTLGHRRPPRALGPHQRRFQVDLHGLLGARQVDLHERPVVRGWSRRCSRARRASRSARSWRRRSLARRRGRPTLAACQATSPAKTVHRRGRLGQRLGLARRQHHSRRRPRRTGWRWPGRCRAIPPSPAPPCRRAAGPWRHTLRRPCDRPRPSRPGACAGYAVREGGRGWAVPRGGAVGSRRMNRLASETSPYLRQHADNPVDWYPWGDEAFALARAENRPVFLSVGYSACHWCHVMAHESFEDDQTAKELNARFVSIKVDREERPDVDAVYMEAVQAMTGSGGWPMTVFLTPDGRPFFGGTYFPPRDGHGMPSFRRVLDAVDDVWHNRRDEVDRQADALADAIERRTRVPARPRAEDRRRRRRRSRRVEPRRSWRPPWPSSGARFDGTWGGFGPAPKFPQAQLVELCLRHHRADRRRGRRSPWPRRPWAPWRRAGSTTTSEAGSPATPPTPRWTVPHFEKMLYDQAGLVRAYPARLAGHRRAATGSRWSRRPSATCSRELASPGGGLYSAQDADSEGEEGRFYVWTPGRDRPRRSGPSSAPSPRPGTGSPTAGNFEGRNILRRPLGAALARPPDIERGARSCLFAARAPPGPSRARRQGAHRVERHVRLGTGRSRRRHRARGLGGRGGAASVSSSWPQLRQRRDRAVAALVAGRPGPASRLRRRLRLARRLLHPAGRAHRAGRCGWTTPATRRCAMLELFAGDGRPALHHRERRRAPS